MISNLECQYRQKARFDHSFEANEQLGQNRNYFFQFIKDRGRSVRAPIIDENNFKIIFYLDKLSLMLK